MRISTNQVYDQAIRGVIDNQSDLLKTQNELATGKAINSASDDPVGAAQVLRLTQEIEQLDQFKTNNTLLQNALSTEEAVLRNVTSSTNRANQLIIQAGNGINTQADREAIASELAQIRDEVIDLMNTRNADGDYIFAGFQADSPAFIFDATATGNKYQFQGDEGQNEIQISDTVSVANGDSGKEVFEDVLARLKSSITGGTATSSSLKITQQDTFDAFHSSNYDAVTAANNVFTGTVNGAGTQVDFTDAGGTNIGTVNFTSGQPFTFQGVEFNIAATAGQTVEFTLSQPEKKNLAESLNDVVTALNDSTLSSSQLDEALADALVGLENGAVAVSDVTARIGGRINIADSVLESNQDLEIANKDARSKIQDVDYAEAVANLSKQETALQAAQQTFGRVTQLSLFDFI
ncbi:MAG: flagellar hook-associated protein 3 [Alteromonadaceae bacterium]|nr:flagellar hook-associated protein 3 [Alteromonadaceae bacterium]